MRISIPGMGVQYIDEPDPRVAPAAAAAPVAAPSVPTGTTEPSALVQEAMRLARERASIRAPELLPQNVSRGLVDPATRTLADGTVVDQNGATVPTASEPPATANTEAHAAQAEGSEAPQPGAAGQADIQPVVIDAADAAKLDAMGASEPVQPVTEAVVDPLAQ